MKEIVMNDKTEELMGVAFGGSSVWTNPKDEKDVRKYYNGLQSYVFNNIVDEDDLNGGEKKAVRGIRVYISKLKNKVVIDDKYLTRHQQRYIKDNILDGIVSVIKGE